MNSYVSNTKHLNKIFAYISKEVELGKVISLSYDEVKQSKTKKQLGFIWSGIIKALQQFDFDNTGEKLPADSIKTMLYDQLLKPEIKIVLGKKVLHYVTLSQMDIEQAGRFIEDSIDFCDSLPDFTLPVALRYTWVRTIKQDELDKISGQVGNWDKIQPEYLQFIRNQFCLYCGAIPPCHAHHVRYGTEPGTAKKPADYYAIPLCSSCHEYRHSVKSGDTFFNDMKGVFWGYTPKLFCEINFYKWYKTK